jgi:hypothetical protein
LVLAVPVDPEVGAAVRQVVLAGLVTPPPLDFLL